MSWRTFLRVSVDKFTIELEERWMADPDLLRTIKQVMSHNFAMITAQIHTMVDQMKQSQEAFRYLDIALHIAVKRVDARCARIDELKEACEANEKQKAVLRQEVNRLLTEDAEQRIENAEMYDQVLPERTTARASRSTGIRR